MIVARLSNLAIILAVIFSSVGCGPSGSSVEAERDALVSSLPELAGESWETGRSLVEQGKYDEAIACFDRALELEPEDLANYCERGNAYLLKGDADAAIADFTQFIHSFGNPRNQCWLEIFHFGIEKIGDFTVVTFTDDKILDEESIQYISEQLISLVDELGCRKIVLDFQNVEYMSSAILGRLITLNKKLRDAGGRLTLCNMNSGIYEVFEITRLSKLFNIGPHPGKEIENTGVSEVASSLEPPDAAAFLQSRHWRNGLAIAHANRGAAFSHKGDCDAAIADYTEAIRLCPSLDRVYVDRGNAYAGKQDYRRAVEDYTSAIRLGNSNAFGERAKAYRDLGDGDKAAEDERSMSACDYSARGEGHLDNGEVEEAIAALTEAVRLNPTSKRYFTRARAFQAEQRYDRAIADYSEAVRLDPQDAKLYLMRATLYELTGEKTLAKEDEKKVEELRQR